MGALRGFSVLQLVKPFMPLIPQIQTPDRKVPVREKTIFTVTSLFIFLVCSQLPLYGLHTATGSDPFYWMRAILASSRGTIMELGISPIVTASTIMQLLPNFIKFNNNSREDRALMDGASKLLGILIALGQAVAYVLMGMYGSMDKLGVGNAILIIAQLFFGSIMVMSLDEILTKGYGLGSGISLFTATNTFESITWKALSPMTISDARGVRVFEGAVTALFHLLITRTSKISALKEAFFRQNLPNMTNLLATVMVFLVVIYLQGFRLLLPVRSRKVRGQQGSYPIKLFYTSNMPIILLAALVSQLSSIFHLLQSWFGANLLTNIIGGITHYITAPSSLVDMAADPFRAGFYVVFVLSACAVFSKAWVDVSGSSATDVAKQMREQNMEMPGHRGSSLQRELNYYILTAAAFGGICIGALTIFADIMGAIGSGTGILLAVTVTYQLLETIEKERASVHGLGFH